MNREPIPELCKIGHPSKMADWMPPCLKLY
jgi:hypothetical protein